MKVKHHGGNACDHKSLHLSMPAEAWRKIEILLKEKNIETNTAAAFIKHNMTSAKQQPSWATQLMTFKNDTHFRDMVIRCENEDISVHKVIVCSHSPVLRAACTGKFTEKVSGKYEIKDCSIYAVRAMVGYMYTGDYRANDIFGNTPLGPDKSMTLHAQVLALADKYLIPGLQILAEKKLTKEAYAEKDTSVILRCTSKMYESESAASAKLRRLFIDVTRQHLQCRPLVGEQLMLIETAVFKAPVFGSDLLKDLLTKPFMSRCQNCGIDKTVRATPLKLGFTPPRRGAHGLQGSF